MRRNQSPSGDRAPSYRMGRAVWIALAVILLVYALIFALFVLLGCTRPGETGSLFLVAAILWIVFGWIFPWLAWIFALRRFLPVIREPAAVVAKRVERDYLYNAQGSCPVDYRYVTFQLAQSDRQVTCVVPKKYYNLLSVGDRGVISYKETKKKFIFRDFIRDGV